MGAVHPLELFDIFPSILVKVVLLFITIETQLFLKEKVDFIFSSPIVKFPLCLAPFPVIDKLYF